jgi:hypothetical protein
MTLGARCHVCPMPVVSCLGAFARGHRRGSERGHRCGQDDVGHACMEGDVGHAGHGRLHAACLVSRSLPCVSQSPSSLVSQSPSSLTHTRPTPARAIGLPVCGRCWRPLARLRRRHSLPPDVMWLHVTWRLLPWHHVVPSMTSSLLPCTCTGRRRT